MPTPWIPRRLQIAFLAALIAALTANFVADVYQLARGTVKELADVRTLVPAEQGKITLAVVPESRRTVRERFLIFFGKTYYLTTYRIEIENHNAIPPIDGRLSSTARAVASRASRSIRCSIPSPLPAVGQAARSRPAATPTQSTRSRSICASRPRARSCARR